MIVWDTDTDVFHPGQWIRGHAAIVTLNPTGELAAIGVMGAPYHSGRHGQYYVVCRPPYFTAMQYFSRPLCFGGVAFTNDGRLITNGDLPDDLRFAIQEPLLIKGEQYFQNTGCPLPIDARHGTAEGVDHRGRTIQMEEGRIFVVENGARKLLFDTNLETFKHVKSPGGPKSGSRKLKGATLTEPEAPRRKVRKDLIDRRAATRTRSKERRGSQRDYRS